MAISSEIEYGKLSDLYLDPTNPRLGRANTGPDVKQSKILELMKDWSLDELAVSFMESGFWPHEAVLVVNERLYGRDRLVVVEGNRRVAALKLLRDAVDGKTSIRKWVEIAESLEVPPNLFDRIPYIRLDSRDDVDSFLGFRHVTGIAEWKPAEKAEYIAKLIETRGFSYREVMRKIGSKTNTVRQNYISYRLLLQMEDRQDIDTDEVEDRFSVLYLSLRTSGVQKYLQIDLEADPKAARRPVPRSKLAHLSKFALWLFGNGEVEPVVSDSRQVDAFGVILESNNAVAYLERTEKPRFDIAYRLAGGDEPELIRSINIAADNVETALSRAHLYTSSLKLQSAVERLGLDVSQLLKLFPEVSLSLERRR